MCCSVRFFLATCALITDPVNMITPNPAILGYAQERLLLCGRIVTGLDNGNDQMLVRLIKEPRAVIDAVAAAQPRSWSEVRAVITRVKGTSTTLADFCC